MNSWIVSSFGAINFGLRCHQVQFKCTQVTYKYIRLRDTLKTQVRLLSQ